METIAFGWASLTWWTWPLLILTVTGSVWLAWLGTLWQERRHQDRERRGKYPCLRHMEKIHGIGDLYCGMLDGHAGDCGGQVIGGWAVEVHGD